MILDGHIHIEDEKIEPELLNKRLAEVNISGGLIISLPPAGFTRESSTPSPRQRLSNLLKWTQNNPDLYPFYWIDPTEADALAQVDWALELGVMGFKIICTHFYCGDERAMPVYKKIAEANKPILFHSGILWDGYDSSKYNRPGEFEPLLEINGLRFALAHVSWPWCDECIAVYSKFLSAYKLRPDISVEMFIDVTPGTPKIYRTEVLTKLFTVGYDIENNIIFGTDGNTNDYNCKWACDWIETDNKIYKELGLSKETLNKIYAENLKRFLGIAD